ncbi:MAG: fumarylacetoacetate hydrolase family protein [Mycobacterium sp.]
MRGIRRAVVNDIVQLQMQDDGGQWAAVEDPNLFGAQPFSPDWQLTTARRQLEHSEHLLPFQPLSFRDFLLSERHHIEAASGMMRRFHPAQRRVTSAVEAVTRKPFPLFKPHALFYKQPIYYMSNHLTFVPSGTPVAFPRYSDALDFELEIGFVLAKPLLDASPQEALDAIGAFVLVNDFSARDVQRTEMASGFGPQKSKHFTNSMSATAVTADEILPRIDALRGTVLINGEIVSEVSSAGMHWGLGDVLAHASRSEQLYPGELFATGTLPGGSGMDLGRWLRPGDELQLTLEGVGEIQHTISAGAG